METDALHRSIRMNAARLMLVASSHLIVWRQTRGLEKGQTDSQQGQEEENTLHAPPRRNVALFHPKQTGSTPSRPEKLKLHFHWLPPKQLFGEHKRAERVSLSLPPAIWIPRGHCATPTSHTVNSVRIAQHSCHIQGGVASSPTH